jgi:DNA topoisomerase-3
MLYAKKIAQGQGLVIPEEAKASLAALSVWIDSNRDMKRHKGGRRPPGSIAPHPSARTKGRRKRKGDAASLDPAQPNSIAGTPLRIPYGNKDPWR